MGVISGGAIPHVDTQPERIPDFQTVLEAKSIEPVLALGEDVMAIYENEELKRICSPQGLSLACWVYRDRTVQIKIETDL